MAKNQRGAANQTFKHYMDIVDEVLVDMIPKIILKCMVYKFRTDMSEGFCILSKIKKDEKEDEFLAVDLENIKRVENLIIETEKLSRGLNIKDSFQYNLSKYTSNIRTYV